MTLEKIDIKNWKQFLNKNDNNTTREINHILSEKGFVFQDIYNKFTLLNF